MVERILVAAIAVEGLVEVAMLLRSRWPRLCGFCLTFWFGLAAGAWAWTSWGGGWTAVPIFGLAIFRVAHGVHWTLRRLEREDITQEVVAWQRVAELEVAIVEHRKQKVDDCRRNYEESMDYDQALWARVKED